MKRDMELVRKILLAVEDHDSAYALRIEGATKQEIDYHAHLMSQANLLTVIDDSDHSSTGQQVWITSMTWEGHEFLDAARNDTVWNRTKEIVSKAGGATFSVWRKVLRQQALKLMAVE